jgi:cold shock protein
MKSNFEVTMINSFFISTHMNGTIKKLTDKNFGFISPEEGDKDLFFHANELVDTSFEELREGDAVSFELSDTPKGPAATQVKRV